MPYTKPYTYVDGNALAASDQNSNDTELKIAVNQETVAADYANAAFETVDFQSGELDPIVNHHTFVTGEIWGQFNDSAKRDRSYFTSHTKISNTSQTSNTSRQYQAIAETGDTIVLKATATVFITFGGAFVSEPNDVVSNGRWDSRVYLMISTPTTPNPTIIQGTRSYSYEETTAASAGTTDPGAVMYTSTPTARDQTTQCRRWVGFQWTVKNLAAGTYRFYVAANPKVEVGYSSARSYTMEIFYT
jgi:hypothetical protein